MIYTAILAQLQQPVPGAAGAGGWRPAGVGFMLSSDKQIEHLEKLKAYADDYANFEAEQQAMLWQQQADYENKRLALAEQAEDENHKPKRKKCAKSI
jgi:hypothetical protein